MRGRKSKPTRLKQLAGKPGHRRLPKNEPKPEPGIPAPPISVEEDRIALLEWNRIVPLLARMRILSRIHMAALAAYCMSFSEWQRAEKDIRKNGLILQDALDSVKRNPAVVVSNHAKAHMRAFLVEFGLTPSAQSRINVSSSEETDKQAKAKRFFGD